MINLTHVFIYVTLVILLKTVLKTSSFMPGLDIFACSGLHCFIIKALVDPHSFPTWTYSIILLGILHRDIHRTWSSQSILLQQTLVASFSITDSACISALHTLSSLKHPSTARRNFISADCKAFNSSYRSTHYSEPYNSVGTAITL